jgi:hypothetical protein
VPVLASAVDAGRSTAFRDVGQDDDLGVAGHAPAFTKMLNSISPKRRVNATCWAGVIDCPRKKMTPYSL